MTRRVRVAGSLFGMTAIIIAVAVVTLLILNAVGGSAQQGARDQPSDNLLLVTDRQDLRICVDVWGVDRAEAEKSQAVIQALWIQVTQAADWSAAKLDTSIPVVDIGCPGPPELFQRGNYPDEPPSFLDTPGRLVADASPYRVHVYVASADALNAVQGYPGERLAPEERLALGSISPEVTTGLYISPSDLDDPALMVRWLRRSVGVK